MEWKRIRNDPSPKSGFNLVALALQINNVLIINRLISRGAAKTLAWNERRTSNGFRSLHEYRINRSSVIRLAAFSQNPFFCLVVGTAKRIWPIFGSIILNRKNGSVSHWIPKKRYGVRRADQKQMESTVSYKGGPCARSCHKMCLDWKRRKLYTFGRYYDSTPVETSNDRSQ